ncbi:hypothetical protein ACFQV2_18905 [Actinokineospora soli]|uniref:Uncharacterized protein n=1 Tax=Actinokineospora soli TaxID=1048753 RepID=A0ABW2TR67_9PSEU
MTTTFEPGGTVTGTLDITGDSGPCRPLGTRTGFTATFTGTRL